MTFILVWIVVTVTAGGPVTGPIPEMTKFKSETECTEFGKGMAPRVADFTRGMLRLDWTVPVHVTFRCAPAGQDA